MSKYLPNYLSDFKGTESQDFRLQVFLLINPPLVTDSRPNIFSNFFLRSRFANMGRLRTVPHSAALTLRYVALRRVDQKILA
jgi:hypothetical protein